MNAQLLLPPPSTSRHEIPVLMNVVKRIEKNSSRKKTRRHQQSSKQFSAYDGPQDRGSATESNLNNQKQNSGNTTRRRQTHARTINREKTRNVEIHTIQTNLTDRATIIHPFWCKMIFSLLGSMPVTNIVTPTTVRVTPIRN